MKSLSTKKPNLTRHAATEDSHALPPGWRRLTLGEKCDILAGFGFPERFQGKSSGDLPFYKVGDISETWKRGDTFLTNANHYISHTEARELRAKALPANTTVFAKIGAAIALNRRAILSEPSLVDNNVMGLHPGSDDLDFKFLFHFICTLKLDELSRATTVPSIRKSDIESIAIPVPPPMEQQRIVAEIEKQFTRLETGVAALRRVQANLKRYRAAVLKAACEGKLVPTEADLNRKLKTQNSKFETGAQLLARILAERRKNWLAHQSLGGGGTGRGKYKEPAAPSTTHMPPLPAGWCYASLEQLTSTDRPICYGILMPKENVADGVLYVKVKDMKGDRIDIASLHRTTNEIASKYARASLRTGDLLLAIRGTYGRVAEVPKELDGGNITQDTARLDVTGLADHRFVATCLRNPDCQNYFKRVARGVAVKGVNIGDVRPTPIPLPPLAEQTRIVAEVERRLSVVDELKAVASANLQRATRLRQSILQIAFTGELTA